MSDIAALGFEIDSTQARNAAKDLDRLTAAADKTERSAKKLSTASRDLLRDEGGRFMTAAAAADKYGAEIEQLRMKYNPLYAASKQFEAQQGELQRALALGAISVAQYDAALEGLQGGMVRSGGAVNQFGKTMAASSQHTTNMLFQFQDIGMMLASGQNPLMLAMQQGTQVAGIFKQMEGTGQSAFSAIKGGLLGLISPTSLLTLGVIAGGAALVQWGMSAAGAAANAQTFHDAVDGLDSNVSELNESVGLLAVDNYDKMLEKYGLLNQAVYDNIANIAGLNAQLISIAQIDLSGLFSEEFGGYLTNRIDEMRIAFDTTNDQARQLLMLMDNVATSKGPDQLISSLTAMRDKLIDTAGGIDNLTIKQAEFVLEISRAIDKANIAKGKLKEMGAAAPDGNWMNPAIGGIDALISRADAALNRVNALRGAASEVSAQSQFDRDNKSYSGRGGDPRHFTGTGPSVFVPNDGAVGVGGGGGGGTDPYAENLTRLIESLQTERETVDAWYNENLTILNDRRSMEVLGEQGHKDAMLDLEREYLEKKKGLNDGYGQFSLDSAGQLFGELYSLSGSKYEGLLKMQKGFAAASALINAYTAASQALASPEVPFFAKFAAVAKVLATGMGLVNAIKGSGSGGGGSSGSASATTSATSAARAEPEKVTRIELIGEDWIVNLVEPMISQIYDASKNGRVIVARG